MVKTGERVTVYATGTVAWVGSIHFDLRLDGSDEVVPSIPFDQVKLVKEVLPEPPVGSVVVYDNEAYLRDDGGWQNRYSLDISWDIISDGDVIFNPRNGS